MSTLVTYTEFADNISNGIVKNDSILKYYNNCFSHESNYLKRPMKLLLVNS